MRTATPSDRDTSLPGGLDHGRMRGLLGYNLAQAAIPSLKIFNKRIGEPFQLRRIDFTILMLVASNPDVTQRQMSLALDVSAPRLTLVCDKLVERGQADVAACARAVVDDDLLAEPLAELGRDDADGRIRRAAGRKGHDHADRLARPGGWRRRLRVACHGCCSDGDRGGDDSYRTFHWGLHQVRGIGSSNVRVLSAIDR